MFDCTVSAVTREAQDRRDNPPGVAKSYVALQEAVRSLIAECDQPARYERLTEFLARHAARIGNERIDDITTRMLEVDRRAWLNGQLGQLESKGGARRVSQYVAALTDQYKANANAALPNGYIIEDVLSDLVHMGNLDNKLVRSTAKMLAESSCIAHVLRGLLNVRDSSVLGQVLSGLSGNSCFDVPHGPFPPELSKDVLQHIDTPSVDRFARKACLRHGIRVAPTTGGARDEKDKIKGI